MRTLLILFCAGVMVAQAPVGNLSQLMWGVFYPSSNLIFDVQTKLPKGEREWTAVENAAIAIADSTPLLIMDTRQMKDGRPVPSDHPDWKQFTNILVQASKVCYDAAHSRSQGAVSDCTNGLTEACLNCHQVYRRRTAPAIRR